MLKKLEFERLPSHMSRLEDIKIIGEAILLIEGYVRLQKFDQTPRFNENRRLRSLMARLEIFSLRIPRLHRSIRLLNPFTIRNDQL